MMMASIIIYGLLYRMTQKCQPERIEELKVEHSCIGKPFNMSAKHWIGIDANTAPDDLLRELTRNSYEIVKAKYKTK